MSVVKLSSTDSAAVTCRVCQQQPGKYTCPRCNAFYCSVSCYKRHGEQCTESFYKDQVMEHLKTQKIDKSQVNEILRRVQGLGINEDEEEEEEEANENDDRFARLSELAASGDLDLQHLTDSERRSFFEALRRGEVAGSVTVWEPWWINSEPQQAIIEAVDEAPVFGSLPPVSTLTSNPSPLLRFNIVDLIYSYCFLQRRFNGDWSTDGLDAVTMLLQLSEVCNGRNFTAVGEPIHSIIARAVQTSFLGCVPLPIAIHTLSDVQQIFSRKNNVLRGLSELHGLLNECLGKGNKSSQLKRLSKKMYFYLVWANEQPAVLWMSLREQVQLQFDEHLRRLEAQQATRIMIETSAAKGNRSLPKIQVLGSEADIRDLSGAL
eukprot:GILK01005871.1.p1 GENE.GILK01005871.1~~GILK01005871.1.p1  ORF type:complete len:377 (-),score=46.30 GILK01005871.1:295-1425(-)